MLIDMRVSDVKTMRDYARQYGGANVTGIPIRVAQGKVWVLANGQLMVLTLPKGLEVDDLRYNEFAAKDHLDPFQTFAILNRFVFELDPEGVLIRFWVFDYYTVSYPQLLCSIVTAQGNTLHVGVINNIQWHPDKLKSIESFLLDDMKLTVQNRITYVKRVQEGVTAGVEVKTVKIEDGTCIYVPQKIFEWSK